MEKWNIKKNAAHFFKGLSLYSGLLNYMRYILIIHTISIIGLLSHFHNSTFIIDNINRLCVGGRFYKNRLFEE